MGAIRSPHPQRDGLQSSLGANRKDSPMGTKKPYDPNYGMAMKGGGSHTKGPQDPNPHYVKTMPRNGKTGSQHGKLQSSGKKC